jgi:carboxynorspermidine decarboxylase
MDLDLSKVPSPCFVLDQAALERNLQLIDKLQHDAGVSFIVAFKGFAMWSAFPLVAKYLKGASASSLNEVLLCNEEMKCKAHTYAPVYFPAEFSQIAEASSHITFNSLTQLELFREQAIKAGASCGLRVNPLCSVVATDLYNPSSPQSRLGILPEELPELPGGVEGLHFHALCESGADELEAVLTSFEQNYKHLLGKVKWINMGGGHLVTRKGYDTAKLVKLLSGFRNRYGTEIILEPGSAVAWETGVLVATVMDIVQRRGISTAITDISFTAHMPDTLEMPYRPRITGAGLQGQHEFSYRIGGLSCLAGDYIDGYSFPQPLAPGQKIVFEDMIHYTMVKTSSFNGVGHPSIAILRDTGKLDVVRSFGYADYKNKLS